MNLDISLNSCEQCCTPLLIGPERHELHKRFELLHSKGAERFGVAWLHFNNAAIAAARSLGFEPSDLIVKALCTAIAYQIGAAVEDKSDGETINNAR